MYNLVILATGTIGRSYYQPGQVIDVIIDLVAFHRGFFAFKICPQNNPQRQFTKSKPIQVLEDLTKILKVVIHGQP